MTALAESTAETGEAGSSPRPNRGRDAKRLQGSPLTPWLFLAPALILFVWFKFIPMLNAITMSFQDVKPYLGNTWVGTENYTELFTDAGFGTAVWHTIVLAVGQTVGSITIGFLLALVLEGQARRLWFVRSAAFLPVVAPTAVIAEVWRIIYHPDDSGLANTVIGWVGAGPSEWINAPDTSLVSIMITGIWKGAPYDMIIIIAGLVGINRSLYEAAAMDGAGPLKRIQHITIPALRPVAGILVTLAAIRGLKVFTEVFLLTNGGPAGSSEVVMTLVYKLGFEQGDLGVAAAGSLVLFVATAILTVTVQVFRARSKQ